MFVFQWPGFGANAVSAYLLNDVTLWVVLKIYKSLSYVLVFLVPSQA